MDNHEDPKVTVKELEIDMCKIKILSKEIRIFVKKAVLQSHDRYNEFIYGLLPFHSKV